MEEHAAEQGRVEHDGGEDVGGGDGPRPTGVLPADVVGDRGSFFRLG